MNLTKSFSKRIAVDSLMIALSLILSYLEAILPLNLLIPIPGFKLGLSNIVIMFVFLNVGAGDAFIISMLRVVLSSLLFSSVISMAYSFCGAIFAFAGILIFKYLLSKYLSIIGGSVICAVLHCVGQIVCACVLLSSFALTAYLPVMMYCAIVTGVINGFLCILLTYIFEKGKIYA